MNKEYKVGQHVKFVDPKGKKLDALITIWWGAPDDPGHYNKKGEEPGCNLIVICTDVERQDSCGRQSEHFTSVVHKSNQGAPGNYWVWPDEV